MIMATTKQTKKNNKEEKNMSKKKVVATEVKVEEVTTEEVKQAKVNKKEKAKVVGVQQMTNSELAQLFQDNGCRAYSGAKDSSKVVYNQFGTHSRVLQQTRGYQLLLTNGKTKKKNEILDVGYNDVERFKEWFGGLTPEQKAMISGDVDAGKLSDSEFPREKTVKINSFDLLVEYIKYMGTFDENKVVVA
jgi:hypothetical protein